jgi:hypothetical protein
MPEKLEGLLCAGRYWAVRQNANGEITDELYDQFQEQGPDVRDIVGSIISGIENEVLEKTQD